jgi:hypothetical protein
MPPASAASSDPTTSSWTSPPPAEAPNTEPPAGGTVRGSELEDAALRPRLPCSRCERHGGLKVAKLIERHGADTGLPDLRGILARDCPRSGAASIHDRCDVHYPQLVAAVRSLPAPTI